MLTQPPTALIGSIEIFWPLIEPILAALQPRRVCEIGVAAGALTDRLLTWADQRDCVYVGIDPAPEPAVRERFTTGSAAPRHRLLRQTSHDALPDLTRCDVYFLDGDHNYFTVYGELRMIAAAIREAGPSARSPVIFMHDVGWPWGRRDMYYLPSTVPADARWPWSETLGVPLDGEGLVEGGLREPGRYAIALRPGGPRNGVLTALEDFLRGEDGAGWESTVLPVAYGLAVLHRPADPCLPVSCRERLDDLRKMAATGGTFLHACEQNYLWLNLYGEYYQHAAATASAAHDAARRAYDGLLAHNREMESAYNDLRAHSQALESEYEKLAAAYEELREFAVASAGSAQPAAPGTQFE